MHPEGRKTGGNWDAAAIKPRNPELIISNHQIPENGKERFFPGAFGGEAQLCQSPDYMFLAVRMRD